MLSLDEIEPGASFTHKNTGLRYTVVTVEENEILLEPETSGHEPLMVKTELFLSEFIGGVLGARRGRRAGGGGRSRGARRTRGAARGADRPEVRGRVKKLVPDRGFGFMRGDDGKEVFFHRSGLGANDYDALSEGDIVEYVVQEGPRGPRAENVRAVASRGRGLAFEHAPSPLTR